MSRTVKIWKSNNKKKIAINNLDMDRIPRHIAIIMDGNGRWAERRGMPRAVGHRAGVETLKEIVRCSDKIGVKFLSVYAFSTENWKRPQPEIGILMSLLKEYVIKELDELHSNNVKICTLGDVAQLPEDVKGAYLKAYEKTKENTGLVLNVALNYGSRAELLHAVKAIADDVLKERLKAEEIDEDLFETYLYTNGCPEPELLIRTSGEMRLSNFMLWQSAYSEIVIVNEYWPDFNEKSFLETVKIYQNRERRFGGIKKAEEEE